ncbi:MAG: site-specific integrase [Vogesella sp.]|uniref:site-specific integrase n=1 Tax=Vogesella sp. TaxID=1904252 RepID=UPI00391AF491
MKNVILTTEQQVDTTDESLAQPAYTAEELMAAAQSLSTKREYANDVRYFCRAGGSIPATPEQLVQYLVAVAGKLAVATLERRLVAIHKAHIDQGYPSPVKHDLVKRTMQGIRRTFGKRQRRVKALVRDDLLEVLFALGDQRPIRAARDQALILVGWAAALRRSELVALRCEDVTEYPDGLEILLRRSKTDQEGVGRTCFIPYAGGNRCPVLALKHYREVAGIKDGWLFRAVDRHENVSTTPLSAQSVALILKEAVKKAGGDPSQVSGHSLRAGYCTQAAIAGLQPWQIREQTGHTSDLMLARYIRPVAKRKIPSLL